MRPVVKQLMRSYGQSTYDLSIITTWSRRPLSLIHKTNYSIHHNTGRCIHINWKLKLYFLYKVIFMFLYSYLCVCVLCVCVCVINGQCLPVLFYSASFLSVLQLIYYCNIPFHLNTHTCINMNVQIYKSLCVSTKVILL